jgi:hypothetical protein
MAGRGDNKTGGLGKGAGNRTNWESNSALTEVRSIRRSDQGKSRPKRREQSATGTLRRIKKYSPFDNKAK